MAAGAREAFERLNLAKGRIPVFFEEKTGMISPRGLWFHELAGFNEVKFETIAATDVIAIDLWGDFAEKSAKSLFQMYRANQFAPARVAADLPAIVLDGWQPPAGASLYFSSFGLNVFDIAFAARLLRRAEELGIGTTVPAI